MNIAIVGSRSWKAAHVIRDTIDSLRLNHPDLTIISGGARGVDRIAAAYARECGVAVVEYHADWRRHGRKAGPMRNREIVAAADEVIAYWDGTSAGTNNTIELARLKGIPVEIVLSSAEEQAISLGECGQSSHAQLLLLTEQDPG
jgi:predicted Rossmann fold nucleotide-binding protein DprA/Smf involved in DNA uptake